MVVLEMLYKILFMEVLTGVLQEEMVQIHSIAILRKHEFTFVLFEHNLPYHILL